MMAKCPMCKKKVKTRPSTCRCKLCSSARYFVEHVNGKGVMCFATGHGVKEKDLIK